MPVVRRISNADTLLGVWKITESPDQLGDAYSALYGPHGIPHNLSAEPRRSEWLASRLLLCNLLGAQRQILNDETGRPYIAGGEAEISISHTKGYAVAVVAKSRVGVDAELCNRKVLHAHKYFMNAKECATLQGDNDNLKALLCWSAKESLFKVVGNLGGTFKKNITVEPFELKSNGKMTLQLHDVDEAFSGAYIVEYSICEDLLITLCGVFSLLDNKQ